MANLENTEIVKLIVKRGKEANLPKLDVGEMAFTTDTNKYYVGAETGNKLIADTQELERLTAQLAQKVGGTKKAQLEDLDTTVLSAIEGGEGTTFNLLTVPQDNSVTTAKVLDRSITRSKLLTDFLYNRRIETTESINTIYTDGTYLVSGNNVGTYPPGIPVATTTNLEVKRTSGRWVEQKITPFQDASLIYVRNIDGSNGNILKPWTRVATEAVIDAKLVPLDTRITTLENETPSAGGESSRLAGKKIVCFGDSVWEFGTIPQRIAQRTGATVINVAFGGCRWTSRPVHPHYDAFSMYQLANAVASGDFSLQQQYKVTASDDDNSPIVDRLVAIDWNTVDIIIIGYGGNDFSSGIPIGDADSTDVSTVNGAINHTFEKLQTAYPKIKIMLSTPTWRARIGTVEGDVDTVPNASGLFLKEYVDNALLDAQNRHHIPVNDVYRNGGINKYNYTTYLADKIHPTPFGYEHLGDKQSAFLLSNF